MKAFVAYALVVVGIPILFGRIFGVILNLPIAMIVGLSRRGKETALEATEAAEAAASESAAWIFGGGVKLATRDFVAHACYDACSGFATVLAAGLLFHFLGLPPGVAVLLILAAWEIFLAVRYRESFLMLFSSLAGMVVGWFVVLRLFPS